MSLVAPDTLATLGNQHGYPILDSLDLAGGFMEGTAAQRAALPSSKLVKYMIFYETDTGKAYRLQSDATTWRQLPFSADLHTTTTDGSTNVTALTYSPAADSHCTIAFMLQCKKSGVSSAVSASFVAFDSFVRNGSSAPARKSGSACTITFSALSSLTTATVSTSVSGNNILIRVLGDASTNLTWDGWAEIQENTVT